MTKKPKSRNSSALNHYFLHNKLLFLFNMGTKVFQFLQQSSDISGDAMFIHFLNLSSTGSEHIFQDELSSKTES